jgi:hypothetical protein
MEMKSRIKNPLFKRARKGFRGFPVGTIAFYGPDDKRASKVAVAVIARQGAEPDVLERWYSEDQDLRFDLDTATQISAFLTAHKVVSVVLTDRIIGCPHEEGIDYAEGGPCPSCPFWQFRDRFTGEMIH